MVATGSNGKNPLLPGKRGMEHAFGVFFNILNQVGFSFPAATFFGGNRDVTGLNPKRLLAIRLPRSLAGDLGSQRLSVGTLGVQGA